MIDRLNEQLAPLDLSIVVENNQAETMEDNIDQIIRLAIVGGLLAVVILWLFLKNLRLVFFIALSIPISVYTAFNLFYGAGITINSLTLVGMALGDWYAAGQQCGGLGEYLPHLIYRQYTRTFRDARYARGLALHPCRYPNNGYGLPSIRLFR